MISSTKLMTLTTGESIHIFKMRDTSLQFQYELDFSYTGGLG